MRLALVVLGHVQVVVVAAVEALAAHRALQVEVALALAPVADHVLGVVEELAAVAAGERALVPVPVAPLGQAWLLVVRGGRCS